MLRNDRKFNHLFYFICKSWILCAVTYFVCFFFDYSILFSEIYNSNLESKCGEVDFWSSDGTPERSTRFLLPGILNETLILKPLSGGSSDSRVYTVEVNHRKMFVLKISCGRSISINKREVYTHSEAAKLGMAPRIYYSSPDSSIILMEYLEGECFSIQKAKQIKNIIKLADALSEVHKISCLFENRSSVFKTMEKRYRSFKKQGFKVNGLDEAVEKMYQLKKRLDSFCIPPVVIHGDLHPGNIFIVNDHIKFIDWERSGQEDPFYDLTCLSLCHNLDKNEELSLLTSYLKARPNGEELERYYIIKQMDYMFFAMELFDVSLCLSKGVNLKLDDQKIVDNWEFYIRNFMKEKYQADPQFFCDFARCALLKFQHLNR